jgi:hypothetical protein
MIYYILVYIVLVGDVRIMGSGGAFATKAECSIELSRLLKQDKIESGYCEGRALNK